MSTIHLDEPSTRYRCVTDTRRFLSLSFLSLSLSLCYVLLPSLRPLVAGQLAEREAQLVAMSNRPSFSFLLLSVLSVANPLHATTEMRETGKRCAHCSRGATVIRQRRASAADRLFTFVRTVLF